MALFENFPYTNFHELNLDWIISVLKAIEEDNENIKALIPQIEELIPLIHSLETLPETMENYQEEINSTINELETYINLKLKPLSNIICLTDSYGTDDIENNRTSWCTHLRTMLGLTQSVNFRKIYRSGASFGDDDLNKNLYNIFVDGTSNMTAEQKTLVTDIIIESGINEWNESNQLLEQNMRSLDTYIRENFPNANISLFFCSWSKMANVRYASMGSASSTYKEYTDMCSRLQWNFVFNITPLIIKTNYIDDVHPNSNASYQIATIIYESLLKGNTDFQFNTNIPYTVQIITSSNTRTLGHIHFDGKNFILNPQTFTCDAIPDLASGFTSIVKIGEITTDAVIGYDDATMPAPASIPCKLGYKINNVWSEIDVRAFFRYENGKVNLYIRNNGCFNPIPSPALTNVTDTYILMPQIVLPVWD